MCNPRWAIIVAVLLVAIPAKAEDKYPWNYDENLLDIMSAYSKDAEITLRLNVSPVLRTLVCRLSYTIFTLESLSMATGLTEPRIVHAVQQLIDMDLVNWDLNDEGVVIIGPASEGALVLMRRWSNQWCDNDDACMVGR